MNILYIGDVMGRPGRKVLASVLPGLRIKYDIDVVIAQAENVSHGKGLSNKHYNELEEAGVDGFSGGNHTFERPDTMKLVLSPEAPVTAPANNTEQSHHCYKLVKKGKQTIAIISLLGYTFPNGYSTEYTNPLDEIDLLLPQVLAEKPTAIVVNFHGDLSSEKVMIGHYLDGKVSAVVGDHWHIPSADARVLPSGTAHVTDVGMCGTLNSSLGVEVDSMLKRWRGDKAKNVMATAAPYQFNAVLIKTKEDSLLAASIERIQIYTS
jgi:metallophosphoesterase (TIGR00282 family)